MLEKHEESNGLTFGYNNSHQLVLSYPELMYVETVLPGAMLSGDRTTPLPWQYQVDKQMLWKDGELGYFDFYGNFTGSFAGVAGNTAHLLPSGSWNRSAAYNRALDKLNDEVRGNLDLAVSAAEGFAGSRGLAKKVGTAVDIVRSARRGRVHPSLSRFWRDLSVGTRADLARGMSRGWLNFRYGWGQIMSDVFKTLDEYIRIILNRMKRCRSRGKEEVRAIQSYQGQIFNQPGLNCTRAFVDTSVCEIGVSLDFPDFDLYRWTSMDPVTLGWELIPYSFVVDWFWNLGGYARNFETAILWGNRFFSGYVSETHIFDCGAYCGKQSRGGPTFVVKVLEPFTAWRQVREFKRTILLDYPYPRRPVLRTSLGTMQSLSATALSLQGLDRSFGRR